VSGSLSPLRRAAPHVLGPRPPAPAAVWAALGGSASALGASADVLAGHVAATAGRRPCPGWWSWPPGSGTRPGPSAVPSPPFAAPGADAWLHRSRQVADLGWALLGARAREEDALGAWVAARITSDLRG